jgi:hypothetical protein
VYSDAEVAGLYDVLNPWDGTRSGGDAFFYTDLVTLTETTSDVSGTPLRVDRASLRFLDVPTLGTFLTGAGFAIDAQYGDWRRGPVTDDSPEIITVARRV